MIGSQLIVKNLYNLMEKINFNKNILIKIKLQNWEIKIINIKKSMLLSLKSSVLIMIKVKTKIITKIPNLIKGKINITIKDSFLFKYLKIKKRIKNIKLDLSLVMI